MATNVPISFAIPSENVLSNYDWTDLADGTGYVELNAFQGLTNTTANYNLHTQVVDPAQANTRIGYTYAPIAFLLTAFNSPRRIGGKAMIAITYAIDVSGGSPTGKTQISINLNGVALVTHTSAAETGDTVNTRLITLTVPATNAKVGDVLSLSIVGTDHAGAGSITMYVLADPINRDNAGTPAVTAATNHTNLKLYLPFKIDL